MPLESNYNVNYIESPLIIDLDLAANLEESVYQLFIFADPLSFPISQKAFPNVLIVP